MPVIPTTWDPTRQDVNDFLAAILSGFMAAVPGVIRKQWSEIPQALTGEVPLVYLSAITERIVHDSGLRQTLFTGQIVYVDVAPDNEEANTRANSFADYMREVFTANARILPPGIFQEIGLREGSISQGPLQGFMQLVADYTYVVLEGRS
jgi:hypothetical protein